jgi:hypothetical protein
MELPFERCVKLLQATVNSMVDPLTRARLAISISDRTAGDLVRKYGATIDGVNKAAERFLLDSGMSREGRGRI